MTRGEQGDGLAGPAPVPEDRVNESRILYGLCTAGDGPSVRATLRRLFTRLEHPEPTPAKVDAAAETTIEVLASAVRPASDKSETSGLRGTKKHPAPTASAGPPALAPRSMAAPGTSAEGHDRDGSEAAISGAPPEDTRTTVATTDAESSSSAPPRPTLQQRLGLLEQELQALVAEEADDAALASHADWQAFDLAMEYSDLKAKTITSPEGSPVESAAVLCKVVFLEAYIGELKFVHRTWMPPASGDDAHTDSNRSRIARSLAEAKAHLRLVAARHTTSLQQVEDAAVESRKRPRSPTPDVDGVVESKAPPPAETRSSEGGSQDSLPGASLAKAKFGDSKIVDRMEREQASRRRRRDQLVRTREKQALRLRSHRIDRQCEHISATLRATAIAEDAIATEYLTVDAACDELHDEASASATAAGRGPRMQPAAEEAELVYLLALREELGKQLATSVRDRMAKEVAYLRAQQRTIARQLEAGAPSGKRGPEHPSRRAPRMR